MLGVISLHCNTDRLDNPIAFVLSRVAGISIPLFFMVSGYLQIGKDGSWSYSLRKIIGILRFVFICCLVYWIGHVIHHQELDFYLFKIFLKSFVQKGPFWMFWYFGAMCLLYLFLPLLRWCDRRFEMFYPKLLLGLVCIDFIVFVMTFAFRWEYTIIQSFRMWNWLTYFSLGAMVRKHSLGAKGSLVAVLIAMLIFVVFVFFSKGHINGIEYFFLCGDKSTNKC